MSIDRLQQSIIIHPPLLAEVLFSPPFVCLFVCLFVSRIIQELWVDCRQIWGIYTIDNGRVD